MSDMSVKVLIDLLYDPGKAQQAEKDLLKIEQAIAAADKAAQGLTKDYDLAEQRTTGFGQALDAAAGNVTAAAEAVDRAQASLDTLGSGFASAGSGADAAAAAFERTGDALSAIEGVDPFARLDGSLARAEGQAQQLAAALEAIDGQGRVPPGVAATTAALKEQLTLEEEVRRLLAEPAPASGLQSYFAQMKAEQDAAREALAAPATDGALAAVEATNKALQDEAKLAAEAHEAVSRPVAGGGVGAGPAEEVDERERRGGTPRGEPPAVVPPSDGHGGPGIVGTVLGFEEIEKSWDLFKDSIEHAAETASIDAHLHAANVPQPEIDEMHRAAAEISRESRIFSSNQILEGLKDGRTVLGSTEHSVKAMRDLTKLMVLEESVNPGHGTEGAFDLIKAAEIANKTNSPEQLHDFFDDVAKPTEVFGKTIKPSAYKDFFSRAGAAGMSLPREFIRDVLPHLLQEMPGETVGTMINSMNRALVGGQTTKTAIDSFDSLGLVNWDHVHVDKGKYTTDAGWLKGTDVPNWNPLTWAQEFYEPSFHGKFKPELKDHPLSPEAQEFHYTKDFSNRNVSKATRILSEQKAIIEKDATQIEAAPGLAGVDKLAREDPHLADTAVGSQFANFGQIAGGLFMTPMVEGKNALADILARVNRAVEPVPEVAAGILAATTTGAAYVGAKTLQLLPSQLTKTFGEWAAGGMESAFKATSRFASGPAGGPVAAGVFVTDAMLFHRDHNKAMIEGGHPDAKPWDSDLGLPGLENDPDLRRPRAPHARRPGEPRHVIVDEDKNKPALSNAPHLDWRPPYGSPSHPAGLPIPIPTAPAAPTGGTATPSLAQRVVNNTTNNNTTNAPVTVNAPVSVTVNVASPAAAPAAVGAAVGSAAASAITSAVKQSPGVLHDGYGPH